MFENSGSENALSWVRSSLRRSASRRQASDLRTRRLAAMEEWSMGFEKQVCWSGFANWSNWSNWSRSGNCRLQPGHFPDFQLRSGHFLHCSVTAGFARPGTARALRSLRDFDCPDRPAASTTESQCRHLSTCLRPRLCSRSHGCPPL